MGDSHDVAVTSQIVAALQHDKLNLQTRLADVQLENQVLRKQLYHMSTLLDIAVSKLGTLGVSLETPIDIRALRAEAVKHASAEAEQKANFDAGDLSGGAKPGDPLTGPQKKKRFQLRTQLREHTKAVQVCSFSGGDNTLIVTGGLDRRLVMQNFFSGEKLWDITGHDEMVSDLAWFEGTNNILSASYDGTVKLWDPRQTEKHPLYKYEAGGFVLSATPLDKANVFACADSQRRTYLVDVRARRCITWWEHHARVNSIAFDGSTGHMLTGHSDGHVSVWDIRRVRSSGGGTAPSNPSEEIGSAATSALTTAHNSVQATMGSVPEGASATGKASSISVGLLRPEGTTASGEAAAATPNTLPPAAAAGGTSGAAGSSLFPCVSRFTTEGARAAVSFLGHYHSTDDTKRLVCVSDDNMVRVYRGNLNAPTAGRSTSDLYHLRNVLPGVTARGFPVRSGFWKGNRDKSQVSVFLDDGEKDAEVPMRRLTECDLLATAGPDNSALVFDVTEDNSAAVVERLEGHRDRVTGAAMHHSDNRPIIATTSADFTVRIWVPSKT